MTNKKRRYIQFILNYQRYNKNNITYTKNLLKNNSILCMYYIKKSKKNIFY